MEPAEKKVMDIVLMTDFYALRDTLNLTDRQKDIFEMRYSRGLKISDIATEMNYTEKTIYDEMKIIRQKLIVAMKESL